ncbi:putative DNA primase/helicase [Paraburkholderia youngii]|uniref:AAA family ATPase n=1 Tax=Paraburkholderia youngii TaxID=2782701 RepID=UPI003D251633
MKAQPVERARSALHALDAGCDRATWVTVAMAAKSAGLSEDDFIEWSAPAGNFAGEDDCRNTWRSVNGVGGISEATLFRLALDTGWSDPWINGTSGHAGSPQPRSRRLPPPDPDTVWASCEPVSDHPYLARKRIPPDGLRVTPDKWLAIPFRTLAGELRTLQLIAPDGTKKNLTGAHFGDAMHVIGEPATDSRWFVVEGLATGHAVSRADYTACVAATAGAARFTTVARAIRARWPGAMIVIVGDVGMDDAAAKAAKSIGGFALRWPAGLPKNHDAFDYEQEHGTDSLADLLRDGAAAPGLRYRSESLTEVIADTYAERWAVRGILPADGFMAIFGPSGSGKSFLTFGLAAALAAGLSDWFDHPLTQSRVLYVALEGESGQRRRVLAWQRHTGLPPPEGLRMLRRQPFSLRNPADVVDLIALVKADGAKVLIVDTLNKAYDGGDENSSVDMGVTIGACDEIRRQTGCALVLLAHTGKDAARGLRGHSSMFAALDSAIECIGTESPHEWLLAKAKDEQGGERHHFEVAAIDLGTDAEGFPVSGGVAVPLRPDAGRPVEHAKPPTAANQKLAWHVIGSLLRESRTFGKGTAPPTRPCVTFESATNALAAKLIQYDQKDRVWAAKRTLSAMQTKWYATDEEWLWAR